MNTLHNHLTNPNKTKQGVCHTYIKKCLKAKEELWNLEYFTIQKYNVQKILQKKPKSFKILL